MVLFVGEMLLFDVWRVCKFKGAVPDVLLFLGTTLMVYAQFTIKLSLHVPACSVMWVLRISFL